MQAVVSVQARRAAAAGGAAAAAAAGAAAGGVAAESRAAPPSADLIPMPTAAEIMSADNKALADTNSCVEASQMLQVELRGMGNSWVTVDDDAIGQLLQIGTEMAAQPQVQQAFLTSARRNGAEMTLRLMHEQSSIRSGTPAPVTTHGPPSEPLGHSFLEVNADDDVQSLASSLSLTTSTIDQAEAETNRAFLHPHAAKLQAAARGKLARRSVATARLQTPHPGVLLDHLQSVPYVKLCLGPTQGRDGDISVALRLGVISVKQMPPTHDADAAGLPPKEATSPRPKPPVPMEVASTVAIVVGLLAVVISRNPVAARAAAASAAAVIMAICSRAAARQQAGDASA